MRLSVINTLTRRILTACLIALSFTPNLHADSGLMPVGGVYYDNLNHLNGKIGLALYQRHTKQIVADSKNPEVFSHLSYLYSDLELGQEGHKVSLGLGYMPYGGNLRAGISYAELGNESQVGIETILSALFISAKVGIYQDSQHDYKYLIGLGIGF
ncbi:hypothetical protein [Litoribrevibacter albus]|uniref:Outer membrane protein beta-barrel domain-containing protein n=1 Tax=Litoribrevibacter albus TaxID=1473156 RepID=A0AA37SF43_9GAMM|nr:hypothetical protein [Litoribrevibacter albus]GLQ32929.1 hypothetical protein GCM10007876_34080 [Litoribrevibacter albus]